MSKCIIQFCQKCKEVNSMEKKNFNHGTMVGGIVRIVIALIAVLIAIIVITNSVNSKVPYIQDMILQVRHVTHNLLTLRYQARAPYRRILHFQVCVL